jgi:hypothetical protein
LRELGDHHIACRTPGASFGRDLGFFAGGVAQPHVAVLEDGGELAVGRFDLAELPPALGLLGPQHKGTEGARAFETAEAGFGGTRLDLDRLARGDVVSKLLLVEAVGKGLGVLAPLHPKRPPHDRVGNLAPQALVAFEAGHGRQAVLGRKPDGERKCGGEHGLLMVEPKTRFRSNLAALVLSTLRFRSKEVFAGRRCGLLFG